VEPLAPRWREVTLGPLRAGARTTARVVLENAGGATWRSRGADGLQLSYHWLDRRGNAIVWDGVRTAFPHPVPPGATLELDVPVDGVRPPGRYVLAFDFVEEHRFWLSEVGIPTRDVEVDVLPLIDERRLGVVVHGGRDEATEAALAAQEEPLVDEAPAVVAHLVAGARPAPDWSRLVLDAHAEGWQAVGPAVRTEGRALAGRLGGRPLGAWTPGGRNPRFDLPLLLPSLVHGLEPATHLGLPAYAGEGGLFEGRAVVMLPRRSGRRPR
jgi:hypothetical protein